MENALYIGMSRQRVLESQMTMVANNIANIATPGYRAQDLLFREYITDPKGQGPAYSMVYDHGQFTSTAPGVTQTTGAPLDVALQGPGFFAVTTPQGQRYTRAGNFTLNAQNQLMLPTGELVSSGGGSPITLPAGATDIAIDERGTITTSEGIAGQIAIVEFDNTDALVREGNGLYSAPATANPVPAANTRAMQGMLEASNVQGVVEVTKMINILRDYQSLQRMIQGEHDLERTAIQRLTRQNG
jgi:flagellar basal-body rod protein FlgF